MILRLISTFVVITLANLSAAGAQVLVQNSVDTNRNLADDRSVDHAYNPSQQRQYLSYTNGFHPKNSYSATHNAYSRTSSSNKTPMDSNSDLGFASPSKHPLISLRLPSYVAIVPSPNTFKSPGDLLSERAVNSVSSPVLNNSITQKKSSPLRRFRTTVPHSPSLHQLRRTTQENTQ